MTQTARHHTDTNTDKHINRHGDRQKAAMSAFDRND